MDGYGLTGNIDVGDGYWRQVWVPVDNMFVYRSPAITSQISHQHKDVTNITVAALTSAKMISTPCAKNTFTTGNEQFFILERTEKILK